VLTAAFVYRAMPARPMEIEPAAAPVPALAGVAGTATSGALSPVDDRAGG